MWRNFTDGAFEARELTDDQALEIAQSIHKKTKHKD